MKADFTTPPDNHIIIFQACQQILLLIFLTNSHYTICIYCDNINILSCFEAAKRIQFFLGGKTLVII